MPNGGGQAGPSSDASPPPATEAQRDEANLEFANKQTDLALEYLRDELAKEKPDPELAQATGLVEGNVAAILRSLDGDEAGGRTGAAGQHYGAAAISRRGEEPGIESTRRGSQERTTSIAINSRECTSSVALPCPRAGATS